MADGILAPCNVACGSGNVTVNSPNGSTSGAINQLGALLGILRLGALRALTD